ncbi:MAG TPA: phytanoyl-CoA dioxygenase family protein, partial [Planctomycetaceae bacterium]|nr:phytanoyl-CoA dioxygenase family protein [Planctomycetaceae bacterium]
MTCDDLKLRFERDGYVLLPSVFSPEEVAQLRSRLEAVLFRDEEQSSLRNRAGTVYAARNVLELFP